MSPLLLTLFISHTAILSPLVKRNDCFCMATSVWQRCKLERLGDGNRLMTVTDRASGKTAAGEITVLCDRVMRGRGRL